MSWLFALGCLLAGTVIGAIGYKTFRSDELRIRQLEAQLQQLSDEYESYQKQVHGHFSDSAALVGKLTDSYREVFQHLAQGARSLCPDYIATQLTDMSSPDRLMSENVSGARMIENDRSSFSPPLDYVSQDRDGTRENRS